MNQENIPILLFEIGTEEIPARFIPFGISKLKENAEKLFTDYRLQFGTINTHGTPRRLTLIAELDESQIASHKEVWGPPAHIAFDKDGNLTKAGEAFVKNNNISINDIVKKEKNKGLYICATIQEKVSPTAELLPEILHKLITSFNFPKSMRWGSGNLRFVRPIQWILALYNNKRISFDIGGIKANNMTKGHRFLSPAAFEIKDAKTYINILRNNFVIIDRNERMKIITESAHAISRSVNGMFVYDIELIEHITDLVEYPYAMLGAFDPDYLNLPEELLIIVMKDHQKYLAVRNNQGTLLNHFIVISNTKEQNTELVIKGAQKVLKARFEDAKFYYEEDQKTPLKDRIEGLKKVVFHEKLGTLYDKSKRIEQIATFLAEKFCPDKMETIKISATLCKTDLITGIVREFPELQGIMGGYYATSDGYSREIACAIKEQYLPRHAGDKTPDTLAGMIISLADKIDNLISFFSIGEIPTSTEDPFALRRSCYGVVLLLIAGKFRISAYELFEVALSYLQVKREGIIDELMRFFEQRVEFYLQSKGYGQDIINSLLNYFCHIPLYNTIIRAEALKVFKTRDYYNSLLLGLKRINNIAPRSDFIPTISKDLFTEEAEKILFKEYEALIKDITTHINDERFVQAIDTLSTLQDPINTFFDKVLVMDKDERIRHNRLSLVCKIREMSSLIADFSKLS